MSFFNKKTFINCYMGLALAQCCVGLNITVGKLLVGVFSVFFLLTFRFFIGLAGMLIIAYTQKFTIKKIFESFMCLTIKDRLLFFLQAMCGGFLFNILILYGMKATTAVSAGIITGTTPIVILILSVLFLREKINLQKIFAIFVVVLGLFILNFKKGPTTFNKILLGDFLVLLAVIPEAFFTILSKFFDKKLTEIEAVVLINLFNFAIFLPFAVFEANAKHFVDVSSNVYSQLIIYGVSGGILFFLLWYRNLAKVSAHTAAFFTAFMPISTAILAVLFLNEPIHIAEVFGIFLTILAIFIGCRIAKVEVI